MAELSPAAQAVLDAYENSYTESGLGDKDVLYMLNLTKKIESWLTFHLLLLLSGPLIRKAAIC